MTYPCQPLTDPPDDYSRGYHDGWAAAHAPAKCGHAAANWKDPKFGTPEYDGDERCEICAAEEAWRAKDVGI